MKPKVISEFTLMESVNMGEGELFITTQNVMGLKFIIASTNDFSYNVWNMVIQCRKHQVKTAYTFKNAYDAVNNYERQAQEFAHETHYTYGKPINFELALQSAKIAISDHLALKREVNWATVSD